MVCLIHWARPKNLFSASQGPLDLAGLALPQNIVAREVDAQFHVAR